MTTRPLEIGDEKIGDEKSATRNRRPLYPSHNEAMAQDASKKAVASMLAVGMSPGKGTLGAFYVSPASRALSLAARYYVYGRYKSHLCFV